MPPFSFKATVLVSAPDRERFERALRVYSTGSRIVDYDAPVAPHCPECAKGAIAFAAESLGVFSITPGDSA